ncbi:MAG: hypothetical protein AAGK32_11945, partial [Actinomycetota bacterium]
MSSPVRAALRSPWLLTVGVSLVATVVLAEGTMRLIEPRLDDDRPARNRSDVPAQKLSGVDAALAGGGGTVFVGASDAGSAFVPATVADAARDPQPGYNAAVPGLPPDEHATWAGLVVETSASPDTLVVGINPTQFQSVDPERFTAEAGGAEAAGLDPDEFDEFVDEGVDTVRSTLSRAPERAGTVGGLAGRSALMRNRHWLQEPAVAWAALTGGELATEPGTVPVELRPDGTDPRWDEPMAADEPVPARVTGDAYGAVVEDDLQRWITDLERLGADREVAVVLLPATPQLQQVATTEP